MKFAIACGGTGGHLFPGLAVAEVLRERGHQVLIFVSEKEIDARALGNRPGFVVEKLPSVGMPPLFSLDVISFFRRMIASFMRCNAVFRRERPNAVLGMGGFTGVAPLVAARWRGIPALLHESNAIPGKANRLAARFCRKVLLGFSECAKHFRGPVCVTGTPVRRELTFDVPSRAEARRILDLNPDRTTLLVMGGSQGASGINSLMMRVAPRLAGAKIQIIHLAGKRSVEEVTAAYAAANVSARVLAFCDRMQEVYPAADFAVSRSGAASLTELSWFGLPSVLVPYPHAAEDHQRLNAQIFTTVGAARMILENEAADAELSALLLSLPESSAEFVRMAEAARGLAPRDSACKVAEVLEEVAA